MWIKPINKTFSMSDDCMIDKKQNFNKELKFQKLIIGWCQLSTYSYQMKIVIITSHQHRHHYTVKNNFIIRIFPCYFVYLYLVLCRWTLKAFVKNRFFFNWPIWIESLTLNFLLCAMKHEANNILNLATKKIIFSFIPSAVSVNLCS